MKPTHSPTDSKIHAALVSADAAIKEALDKIAQKNGAEQRDAEVRARLQEQRATLRRTVNPDDPAALAKLAAVEQKLELLDERANERGAEPDALCDELRDRVVAAVPLVRAVAVALREKVRAEMRELFRPFVERDDHADGLIERCFSDHILGGIISCTWADIARHDPQSGAKLALADAAKLLGDRKFWLRE